MEIQKSTSSFVFFIFKLLDFEDVYLSMLTLNYFNPFLFKKLNFVQNCIHLCLETMHVEDRQMLKGFIKSLRYLDFFFLRSVSLSAFLEI